MSALVKYSPRTHIHTHLILSFEKEKKRRENCLEPTNGKISVEKKEETTEREGKWTRRGGVRQRKGSRRKTYV